METPKYGILIVDDEEDIRFYMRKYLQRRLDADIYEAMDGETALKIIHDKKPHLCILDNKIEGNLTGWDVAFKIREVNKECKLVILTGDLFIPEKYAAFSRQEIAEVHQKPLKMEQAMECVQRLLAGVTKSPDPIAAPTQTVRPTISNIKHKLNNITMKMGGLLDYLLILLDDNQQERSSEELSQLLTKMGMAVDEYKECGRSLARLEKGMFMPDDINFEAFQAGLTDQRKANALLLKEMNLTLEQLGLLNSSILAAALNKLLTYKDLFNIVASEIDMTNKSAAFRESFEEKQKLKDSGAEDGLQQFNTMILSIIYMKELKWRK